MRVLIVTTILLLGACSPLDVVKTLVPTAPSLEAQIGSNENKVGTGVASIGSKEATTIEDNTNSNIRADTGRYHLEAKDNLTVTVNETNPWIIVLAGIYIFGRPVFKAIVDKSLKYLRRRKNG